MMQFLMAKRLNGLFFSWELLHYFIRLIPSGLSSIGLKKQAHKRKASSHLMMFESEKEFGTNSNFQILRLGFKDIFRGIPRSVLACKFDIFDIPCLSFFDFYRFIPIIPNKRSRNFTFHPFPLSHWFSVRLFIHAKDRMKRRNLAVELIENERMKKSMKNIKKSDDEMVRSI